jgi:hypothetical protein
VQPGSLFDLEERGAAHLVVSLLPEPVDFDAAVATIARSAGG